MGVKFFIVDAFTNTIFGGNPAGVVFLGDKDFPAEEVMQKTAAELRYSETAFVRQLGPDRFHTRYFTPEAEVDLCGHATVGSFYVLAQEGVFKDRCINETLAGSLNIESKDSRVLMDMGTPQFIKRLESQEEMARLYDIMGIPNVEFPLKARETLYLELISTGLPDILLPVENEAVLESIKPDFPALSKFSEEYEAVGVHAFTLNGKDGAIHCRNFAPLYAIDEEAATGTSNGALTYYLYKNGLIKDGAQTTFIQGEAMGRPSTIESKIMVKEDKTLIQVGGSAVILAKGEIFI